MKTFYQKALLLSLIGTISLPTTLLANKVISKVEAQSILNLNNNHQPHAELNNQQFKLGKIPDGISNFEWQSIHAQVKRGKYKAYITNDGGYQSSNPANGWVIDYGLDGTTTLLPYDRNTDEDYKISLRLDSVSYDAHMSDKSSIVNKPDSISFENNRLNYHWSENITEYWINSEHKLEQWFEIKQRPENYLSSHQNDDLLKVKMKLDSDLEISLNNNQLKFGTITYDQLKVWDANGKIITANFELQNNYLTILIDDKQATYPLTIDPSFAQMTYLKASNTDAGDSFGKSVSISGDTMVIGASSESSNASGVNGDQSNNLRNNSGAVYVFVRTEGSWIQQAYLKASNPSDRDFFGDSVSISGETLVVGSVGESSNAVGVNGNQNNNTASSSGAAYVFVRNGATWSQQAYLKASNTGEQDRFGVSVSISQNVLVVGAFHEESNALGVNGNQSDNSASNSGAAYVFNRNGTTWSQQAYLKASNTDTDDNFGQSVSISGDTLVIGSEDDSNATGVNGNHADNSADRAGAAYVFVRSGDNWSQQAYLKASNTEIDDWFGYSVSISGDSLVVGSFNESSNATGVNGNQSNNSYTASGAAYVFIRNGTTWSQQAYLKASNTDPIDRFGTSVSLSGENLLIGAKNERSNATGVNGNQSDNSSSTSGAAYLFVRNGNSWSQQAYLKASNTGAGDNFGDSVSISGTTMVIGGLYENSSASGVDSDQDDNSAGNAGAAYVFDLAYTVGGNLTNLVSDNSVTVQNNLGNNLILNDNGSFDFSTALFAGSSYSVTVLNQPTNPIQECNIPNGSATITNSDIVNVIVNCNTRPTAVLDTPNVLENMELNAFDFNGLITPDPNDDGVLINDTDPESDFLVVVNPGQPLEIGGIGGFILMNFDGTYTYSPQNNEFGIATIDYQITDGEHIVDAQLIINVLPVNDAPSFTIAGDIELDSNQPTNPIDIVDFITAFSLGPGNESKQQITQYNVTIQSDSNAILNAVSVNNAGVLNIDLANNAVMGVALVDISLQDDGGTENGGLDTSPIQTFYIDLGNDRIYNNGFEGLKKEKIFAHLIQVQSATYGLDYPIYDTGSDAIIFYNELFYLNGDYQSLSKLDTFEHWLKEVLIYKAPYEDYDNDGIQNNLDSHPFVSN